MGLKQLITDPTHVSDPTLNVSLIDHFVTSDPDLYAKAGVIPHGATDHFVIYCSRKKFKDKHEKEPYWGRSYGKMDKQQFKLDILTNNWDEVYETNDAEQAWLVFKTDF